jgi:hypothetical protein
MWYRQGDFVGNVSVLGGDSTGQYEKKVHMNMCLIQNGYGDIALWIYKYEIIVNGNKERTKIIYNHTN